MKINEGILTVLSIGLIISGALFLNIIVSLFI